MERVRRYLAILRVRAARNPFLASVVGRLPISMVPLAVVLLVQQVRGSYSVAGVVTGAYALGATLGTPVLGRLVDRLGQPPVIAAAGTLSALFLVALALTAAGGAGDPLLLALAVGAGLSAPPLAATMRGAWRTALPGEPERLAAYALDAVSVEFVFVVGPLLVGLMLTTTPPAAPLLVTAGLLAVGSLCLQPRGGGAGVATGTAPGGARSCPDTPGGSRGPHGPAVRASRGRRIRTHRPVHRRDRA